MTLRQVIEQEIRELGPIPFSRYMELCLYHPELGYYSRHAEQFGKAGDFYTSSDVHAVFGRLLARQFEEIWRVLGSPQRIEILELGPGRGLFAQDVLDWSEKKFPDFFRALHYSLAESSPALRSRLELTLSKHFGSGKASLTPLSTAALVPGNGILELGATLGDRFGKGTTSVVPKGQLLAGALAPEVRLEPVIIFANEFFDALPVEVLGSRGALRIAVDKGRFVETWAPPTSEEMDFLDRYAAHPEPHERIDVPLIAQQSVARIASAVDRGIFIAIDYGYTWQQQVAGRHRGTVTAFRQHSISPSPYEAPGEQDITAHVNFTALAAAAEQNGMHVHPLLTQSQFLMGIGEANQFADAFEECRLPQERAKVSLQLKHLVTPAGMGESFHVLMAAKGVDEKDLAGLSGLSFATSKR
ncbi:MAG TPA: SAM-dependent methyltransferase [Terriglobales bacterium]|nr:SAM-dependent methyltransferase [Terriglobales bacterium]